MINDDRASAFVVSFYSGIGHGAPVQFLKALRDFRSVTTPHLKLRALRSICRKYVDVDAVAPIVVSDVARRALDERVAAIDDDNPRISGAVFADVEGEIVAQCNVLFR